MFFLLAVNFMGFDLDIISRIGLFHAAMTLNYAQDLLLGYALHTYHVPFGFQPLILWLSQSIQFVLQIERTTRGFLPPRL